MILALETVFEQCSVALLSLSAQVIDELTEFGNRQQTQQILPMIKTLLAKNNMSWQDISAVAFNRGPGAFSGIRINTAVAQALGFAHELPCLPVSSLQAVAQMAFVQVGLDHVQAVIDARMNEVYVGEFIVKPDSSIMQPIQDNNEYLLPYHQLPQGNTNVLVGNGVNLVFPENLPITSEFILEENITPTASIIGQIGANILSQGLAVTAENALPVYLRHNAWKTLEQQQLARQNK